MSNIKSFTVLLNNDITQATIIGWSGELYKISRKVFEEQKCKDINKPGVYFLICDEFEHGPNDDKYQQAVYVGESEKVEERFSQHIADYKVGKEKFYWNQAIVIIDESLDKTLIRYLENQAVETIKTNDIYKVFTKNTYKQTTIDKYRQVPMIDYLENISLLLKTIGYPFLDKTEKPVSDSKYFYCNGNGASAKAYISDNGWSVAEGSMVSDHIVDSFKTNVKSWYELRLKLESDGTIKDRKFTKDYEFSSPSAASAIVLGRPSNGNTDWKNSDGVNYKDIK